MFHVLTETSPFSIILYIYYNLNHADTFFSFTTAAFLYHVKNEEKLLQMAFFFFFLNM